MIGITLGGIPIKEEPNFKCIEYFRDGADGFSQFLLIQITLQPDIATDILMGAACIDQLIRINVPLCRM